MGLINRGDVSPATLSAELPEWATPPKEWPGWARDTAPLEGKYFLDEAKAKATADWFPDFLCHPEGQGATWSAGDPLVLDEWQKERIIYPLFGWYQELCHEGRVIRYIRRFVEMIFFVGRKNAKTTLIVGILAKLLYNDGEPVPETYFAAGAEDQARQAFKYLSLMIENEPRLKRISTILGNTIRNNRNNGTAQVLTKAPDTKHSRHVHCLCGDELHIHQSSELIDTMHTGTAGRMQPLSLYISTAGNSKNHWSYKYYQRGLRLQSRDPRYADDRVLGVVYAAGEKDDWKDIETAVKVNPGIGKTITRRYLEGELKKAIHDPAEEQKYKRLHLNYYTQTEVLWLSSVQWDACRNPVPLEVLRGRTCCLGMDLSSKLDLTSVVAVFRFDAGELGFTPKTNSRMNENDPASWYYFLPFFWIPEDNMEERITRDKVPYGGWVEQGYVMATPGNVVDYRFIRKFIKDMRDKMGFDIWEIGYDPWNATQFAQQLMDEDGFQCVEIRQGYFTISEPAKLFQMMVVEGSLRHPGNPCMDRNVECATIVTDPSQNIRIKKPDYQAYGTRVDGVVAAVMGLYRCRASPVQSCSIDEVF